MNANRLGRWVLRRVVIPVTFAAIVFGFAVPVADVSVTEAAGSRTCCCQFQCTPANANGTCPAGCSGPFFICPDRCRPPY